MVLGSKQGLSAGVTDKLRNYKTYRPDFEGRKNFFFDQLPLDNLTFKDYVAHNKDLDKLLDENYKNSLQYHESKKN